MPDNLEKHEPRGGVAAAVTRVAKLVVMFVFGPFYFIYISFLAPLCHARPGFRGWYWKTVKRACSRLLWLLSIRAAITPAAQAAMAEDENSIIVVNHRSHLDGFALMDTIPDQKWFTFGAKKELCDSALLRRGFTGAGLVEIDRNSGKHALETLTDAVAQMPARKSLVLFPEGTRARSDDLGEFKPGAVLVARKTGRTIRPIVVINADRLLPRGKMIPHTGTIRIEILAPFKCDPNGSVEDDVTRLREEMRKVFVGDASGL